MWQNTLKKETVQYPNVKVIHFLEGKKCSSEEEKKHFTELKSVFIIDFDMNVVTFEMKVESRKSKGFHNLISTSC